MKQKTHNYYSEKTGTLNFRQISSHHQLKPHSPETLIKTFKTREIQWGRSYLQQKK